MFLVSKNFPRLVVVFYFLYGTAVFGRSDRPELAISAIPSALLRNADAVLRNEETLVKVEAPEKVLVRHVRIISLLNAKAAPLSHVGDYNSDLQSVDAMSVTIFDANGKQVEHASKKDFTSIPLNILSPDFSDAVIKTYIPDYKGYPFTLVFTETRIVHHTFVLPDWSPLDVNDLGLSVEQAGFSVASSPQFGLHLRSMGGMQDGVVSGDTVSWHLAKVPVRKREVMEANVGHNTPMVLLAPDTITLNNFRGKAATWNQFGAFIYELNRGRDKLTPEDQAYASSVSSTSSDRKNIIQVLYWRMQQRCRYVSVQLGIGGWQTLPATFVGTNHYGDCKALSNYMMSLLAAAGIQSYPVLIDAGNNYRPLLRDFPVSLFNHEILCVPLGTDTVWLECTSTNNAPGYLGCFTEDRDALMITPNGGILVHTPGLSEKENYLCRHIITSLDDAQVQPLALTSVYSGALNDELYAAVTDRSSADLQGFVSKMFTLPTYTVDSFHFTVLQPQGLIPCMREDAQITVQGLATRSRERLFINMDLMPLKLGLVNNPGIRNTAFRIGHSVAYIDSFDVQVPPGYSIEKIPQKVQINELFGSYQAEIVFDAYKIHFIRKLVLNGGNYVPAFFSAYATLLESLEQASNYQTVLHKQ
jgi:hypothetical protein